MFTKKPYIENLSITFQYKTFLCNIGYEQAFLLIIYFWCEYFKSDILFLF